MSSCPVVLILETDPKKKKKKDIQNENSQFEWRGVALENKIPPKKVNLISQRQKNKIKELYHFGSKSNAMGVKKNKDRKFNIHLQFSI